LDVQRQLRHYESRNESVNSSDVVLDKLDLDSLLGRCESILVDSLVFLLAALVVLALLSLVEEETGSSTDGKDSEGPPNPGGRATSLLLLGIISFGCVNRELS